MTQIISVPDLCLLSNDVYQLPSNAVKDPIQSELATICVICGFGSDLCWWNKMANIIHVTQSYYFILFVWLNVHCFILQNDHDKFHLSIRVE